MNLPLTGHEPVLLDEVLQFLQPGPGQTFVDCTLGRAGHASAIAARLGKDGLLVGLDADPRNLEYARDRFRDAPCQVRLFHANFAELGEVLKEVGRPHVDGILADLGLSTNQLFDEHYGLSFAANMPLDMRIDPRLRRTAADWVNSTREQDLANVLYELAQERWSRRIARKIVEARRRSPITTTEQLAELVRAAQPRGAGKGRREAAIDPATRTFMAIRMAVNNEVANLEALLRQSAGHLASGTGRLAVISFHSTEDRLVKQALRAAEEAGLVKVVTRKPITPSDEEQHRNPRSRSAKLRVARRTSQPV